MSESLIDELQACSAVMQIKINESLYRRIEAAEYHYSGPYDIGVSFIHPKGEIHFGCNHPTNADYYEIDLGSSGLNYERVKQLAEDAISDDAPWIEYGNHDEILPGSETLDRAEAWLAEPVDVEKLDDYLPDELSECMPGHEIWQALDEATCQRLGMRLWDMGGPVSAVMAVSIDASAAELNIALADAGLPFRAVGQTPARRRVPRTQAAVGIEDTQTRTLGRETDELGERRLAREIAAQERVVEAAQARHEEVALTTEVTQCLLEAASEVMAEERKLGRMMQGESQAVTPRGGGLCDSCYQAGEWVHATHETREPVPGHAGMVWPYPRPLRQCDVCHAQLADHERGAWQPIGEEGW